MIIERLHDHKGIYSRIRITDELSTCLRQPDRYRHTSARPRIGDRRQLSTFGVCKYKSDAECIKLPLDHKAALDPPNVPSHFFLPRLMYRFCSPVSSPSGGASKTAQCVDMADRHWWSRRWWSHLCLLTHHMCKHTNQCRHNQ